MKLVARKSYNSSCVEADRVTLYDYLDKSLSHGPYESTLQAFEDSKDGQAVMETILLQHGGIAKWEKAHNQGTAAMKKPWKSTSSITLTDHISSFRGCNAMLRRCCQHAARTTPSEREMVLLMMNLIQSTDPLLNAHIAKIR